LHQAITKIARRKASYKIWSLRSADADRGKGAIMATTSGVPRPTLVTAFTEGLAALVESDRLTQQCLLDDLLPTRPPAKPPAACTPTCPTCAPSWPVPAALPATSPPDHRYLLNPDAIDVDLCVARGHVMKMSSGRNAETRKLGTSTSWLILRSTATLQMAYAC
jgi:hypothetical protein